MIGLSPLELMGRVTKLAPLLALLNPAGLYPACRIARLGQSAGLLQWLYPPGTNTAVQYRRTCVNLNRRRGCFQYPKCGDSRQKIEGQSAWYGWRWQGFQNLQEAKAWQVTSQQPFWEAFQFDALSLESLHKLWVSANQWPMPQFLIDAEDGPERWPHIKEIVMRIWLNQHASARGLEPTTKYTLEEWWKDPRGGAVAKTLRPILAGLEITRPYGIETLVNRAANQKWISPSKKAMLRMGLYQLAADSHFPDLGDHTAMGLTPLWEGWRWQRALASLPKEIWLTEDLYQKIKETLYKAWAKPNTKIYLSLGERDDPKRIKTTIEAVARAEAIPVFPIYVGDSHTLFLDFAD